MVPFHAPPSEVYWCVCYTFNLSARTFISSLYHQPQLPCSAITLYLKFNPFPYLFSQATVLYSQILNPFGLSIFHPSHLFYFTLSTLLGSNFPPGIPVSHITWWFTLFLFIASHVRFFAYLGFSQCQEEFSLGLLEELWEFFGDIQIHLNIYLQIIGLGPWWTLGWTALLSLWHWLYWLDLHCLW